MDGDLIQFHKPLTLSDALLDENRIEVPYLTGR